VPVHESQTGKGETDYLAIITPILRDVTHIINEPPEKKLSKEAAYRLS
jgi:hypothetical protein